MYFCAMCGKRGCSARLSEDGEYPKGCPTAEGVCDELLPEYDDPALLKLAQISSICSPDHGECRLKKTARFARECGFKHLGLAFCVNLSEEAAQVAKYLKGEGFEVESLICKVGKYSRATIDAPQSDSGRAMCNPIAQAELLNRAGTELNIIVGLCVGHDALFTAKSKAPVTTLATKDHVYNNAPLECLKDMDI